MFGVAQKLNLYEQLRYVNEINALEAGSLSNATNGPKNKGTVAYVKDSSAVVGTLQLLDSLFEKGNTTYSWKPFVHTLAAGSDNITVTNSNSNKGKWTIDVSINALENALSIGSGGTIQSNIYFYNAELTNNSFSSDSKSALWLNTTAFYANPTYRYVDVHIFNQDMSKKWIPEIAVFNEGRYIKVFKPSDLFTNDTSVYLHAVVAAAAEGTTVKTEPGVVNHITAESARQENESSQASLKGLGFGRAATDPYEPVKKVDGKDKDSTEGEE